MGSGEGGEQRAKARDRLRGRRAVLFDELALTIADESEFEDRFITIGVDAAGRTLVVIWAWRGEKIRMISARTASRPERRQYEEGP